MAEGLARAFLLADVEEASAGFAPTCLHPLAARVTARAGIDMSAHHAKPIDAVALESADLIVTLCAEVICSFVPGAVQRQHWPLPDPAAAGNIDAFRAARDMIRSRIEGLAKEELH